MSLGFLGWCNPNGPSADLSFRPVKKDPDPDLQKRISAVSIDPHTPFWRAVSLGWRQPFPSRAGCGDGVLYGVYCLENIAGAARSATGRTRVVVAAGMPVWQQISYHHSQCVANSNDQYVGYTAFQKHCRVLQLPPPSATPPPQ